MPVGGLRRPLEQQNQSAFNDVPYAYITFGVNTYVHTFWEAWTMLGDVTNLNVAISGQLVEEHLHPRRAGAEVGDDENVVRAGAGRI